MTIANINVRQVLLKRGNTTVSSLYTGPAGEITVDTTLKAIRVHDGSTPGGWLQASTVTADYLMANVTALWGNAATQQTQINALIAEPTTFSGANPPEDPVDGILWYDTSSGRIYIYYDSSWVDASPENIYTLPTASNIVLGGIKLGDSLSIDNNGVVDVTLGDVHGNISFNDQTIGGTISNRDIVLSPLGTGTVEVPSLKINGYGSITTGTETVTTTIDRLILASTDFSATQDLQIGDYGSPAVIPAPWTALEFTTTPASPVQIGDHISGPGIPVLSYVAYVGSSPYERWVVITTAPVVAPTLGIQVSVTRERDNAATIISASDSQVDISLRPAGEFGRVTSYSSIHPYVTDTYSLGTPARRWREIWLGAGTIYVQDETTGADLALGARNGNLYIQGSAGIEVGEFRIYGNTIAFADATKDIQIGTVASTGNLNINRPLKVVSNAGIATFNVNKDGQIIVKSSYQNPDRSSTLTIIGNDSGVYSTPTNPGGMLHISGHDGITSRIVNDSYGAGTVFSAFVARTAGGTATNPTPTPVGLIARFSGAGYDPVFGFNTPGAAPVSMEFVADQTFSANSYPTSIQFNTTSAGNIAGNTIFRISNAGVRLPLLGTGITFPDSSVQYTAADSVVITANLASLTANAASQQTTINALVSNAAVQSADITTLYANAAAQSGQISVIDANLGVVNNSITTLYANAATQSGQISVIDANLGVVNNNVTALTANAGSQQTSIDSLIANAASQQTQINSKVTTITAGYAIAASRVNGTVGIDNLGVSTVAGTVNQVYVNAGTSAANAAITLTLPQSIAPSSSPTFSNITITGNLTVQGNIINAGSSSLESKILYLANSATSGSELDGGGIVLGNIDAAFARSITYDYNNDRWSTDGAGLYTHDLVADDAEITGNIFSNGAAHFGGTNMVINYDKAEVQIDSNRNDFSQLIQQNHNPGTNASTDFVAANDIGDDSIHYIDLGINSSTYTNPDYSITGPNDGYLYINGGNLTIGTQTAGDVIKFHTSGTTESNLRVVIDDNGLAAVGNVSATYFVGSSQYLTGLYSNANVTAYLTTDSNIAAIWANIASVNSAWQANAAFQEIEIAGLRGNITAANSAIVAANSAVVSYVNDQISQVGSNWTANAAVQEIEIAGLRSNITAANSNIVTANTGMKSYVDYQITTANSAVVSYVNTQISTVGSAWQANAGTQQTEINSLRANITAANAQIVTSYNNSLGYTNSLNLAMLANVNAANTAIQTVNANLGAYQTFSNLRSNSFSANLGAYQTWANATFGSSSYGNTQVAAYLTTYTGNLSAGNITTGNITINGTITTTATSNIQLGNIRIYDQTITGTIVGRDVNIFVNNNGAVGGGGDIVFNSNLMPTRNYIYTLGSKTRRWAKSYHGPKSIDIDGITLETDTDVGGANLYIGNAAILNAPSITSNSVMVATGNITGGNIVSTFSAFFYGQGQTGYDALYAGVQNGYTALPSDVAQFTGNGNTYIQVNAQNISTGNKSTADFVATSNDGTDTIYYVNMGIAGNTYANSSPVNSLGTSLWPRDSYLYAQGDTAANIGGNLVIGTTTPTKTVKIIAGGVNSANVVATYNSAGMTVAGNVTANYYQGDGSKLTNLPSGSNFGTDIRSGQLAIDPASVGKTASSTQTFTLSGLTTNHKVLVTPATDLTYGIFITAAYASATNTLSVQFMNISGGSINLGSINLNYLAWV